MAADGHRRGDEIENNATTSTGGRCDNCDIGEASLRRSKPGGPAPCDDLSEMIHLV
jgi:hypothetical protein